MKMVNEVERGGRNKKGKRGGAADEGVGEEECCACRCGSTHTYD